MLLQELPLLTALAVGSCHCLKPDNQGAPIGDPLELAAFRDFGWQLTSQRVAVLPSELLLLKVLLLMLLLRVLLLMPPLMVILLMMMPLLLMIVLLMLLTLLLLLLLLLMLLLLW